VSLIKKGARGPADYRVISAAVLDDGKRRVIVAQQVKGRGIDKAWAHRMLLGAGNTLTDKAAHRLEEVFAADDATGKLQAVWKVEEQLRLLLRMSYLADAADAAKEKLKELVDAAGRPETNKPYAPSAGGGTRSRSSRHRRHYRRRYVCTALRLWSFACSCPKGPVETNREDHAKANL
jgi:hypothetical protein